MAYLPENLRLRAIMTVSPIKKHPSPGRLPGLAPVKISGSLPWTLASSSNSQLAGLSAGRFFRATCPAGSLEIRVTIQKRLQHERHEIGHLLPGAVGFRIKISVVPQPCREVRHQGRHELDWCPVWKFREFHGRHFVLAAVWIS
jgi:hypothetical protein